MSNLDGVVRIGTEIDDSGFKSGLSKLGHVASTGLKATGVAIGAVSAGMVALGKSAIDTGMAFDTSMSQVAATMGKTVDEIGELRDFALEMGSKTAFSATQAADALNYMALAGYSAEESMEQLPNVLNLAAAGSIDLAYASDMVTDAQSALGLSMEESAQLVDKMAMAASKSNTSVAQLGEAILQVGGTAKNLAGGTTELSTALGILADNGVKGAEGGTALRNIILSLSAPTDNASAALKSLGINAFDAKGNMRSLNDIFTDFNKSLSKMTQEEQTQALSAIFNKTDLKSVNALLANTGERYNELSGYINDAAGAAEKMANTQLDNLEGDITLFKSALEGAQIVISDKLTPSLRDFVQFGTSGLSKITDAFNENGLSGAMEALTNVITEALKRITAGLPRFINVGFELLNTIVSGLLQAVPELAGSALIILDQFAQGLIAATPQIFGAAEQVILQLATGLTQALPSLIPTALQTLLTFSDTLRSSAGTLIDAALNLIVSLGNGIIKSLPELIKTVPHIVINIAGIINDNAPKLLIAAGQLILNLAIGLVKAIPTIIHEIPKIIHAIISVFLAFNWVNFGKNIILGLKDGFLKMIPAVKQSAGNILNSIKNVLSNLPQTLLQIGRGGIHGLINGIKSLFGLLGNAVKGLGRIILDGVKHLPRAMIDIGKNIIHGLLDGIKSMFGSIGQAVANLGSTVVTGVKKVFGIHSPSRVMRDEVGKNLMLGIIQGVEMLETKVVDTITAPVTEAKTKIRNAGLGKDISHIISDSLQQAEKQAKSFKDAGNIFSENLKKGIDENKKSSLQAIEKLIDDNVKAYEKEIEKNKKKLTEIKNRKIEIYGDSEAAKRRKKAAEERKKADAAALQSHIDTLKAEKRAASEYGREIMNTYSETLTTGAKLAKENISKSIEQITETFQEQYDELMQKQKELEENLAGDYLFEVDDGEVITEDLDKSIDTLKQYQQALQELTARGASQDLLDQVTTYDPEKGLAIMSSLLEKSEDEFAEFQEKWKEKRELAAQIAKDTYADQAQAVKDNFEFEMMQTLNAIPEQTFLIGKDSVTSWIEGMNKKLPELEKTAKELAQKAISAMKKELGINSPSKKGEYVGEMIDSGVVKGVEKGRASVQESISKIGFFKTAQSMIPKMQDAVSSVVANISPVPAFAGVSTSNITNNEGAFILNVGKIENTGQGSAEQFLEEAEDIRRRKARGRGGK